MPRYLIGKLPGLHPNSSMYWFSQFFTWPKQKISLLWKLILRPDSCSKAQRMFFMFWGCSKLWSKNKIVSSGYCNIDNPPSMRCGTTPLSWSSAFALFIKSDSVSVRHVADFLGNCKCATLEDYGSSFHSTMPFFRHWLAIIVGYNETQRWEVVLDISYC